MPTWLITGCSSGLGRSLTKAVLERGWNAVVTARDLSAVESVTANYPQTALALELDVSNPQHIANAVNRAQIRFGGIDVLVNNAGHGYRAAVEEGNDADVHELFATNFFGPVALIKATLPGMRARRQGVVVNVSSIAARNTSPGSGYYSATKCALEGMSNALRKEVSSLGVKVMVVEPGEFRTDFSGRSLLQSSTAIADYQATAGQRRKENDTTHGNQRGDPARGAEVIINAVEADNAPFRLLLGSDAVRVIRHELNVESTELDTWEKISVTTDFPV
jgi:NAD(P)-dependent dehydrogenase (short-subunit alcohol dehydrogenase family)